MSIAGPIPTKTLRAPPGADARPALAARRGRRALTRGVSTLLLVASAATLVALWLNPAEGGRIFYIHVPAAIDTFIACGAVCICGMAFLWTRQPRWDRLAAASALVAIAFCTLVLVSGMFWARAAWGRWWMWSPRLTFSLVLWLLYIGYLAIRVGVRSELRRAVVCAVYGLIAFLDVPLVWLSVKLLPDIHPESVQSRMGSAVLVLAWLAALTALATGMVGLLISARPRPDGQPRNTPLPSDL